MLGSFAVRSRVPSKGEQMLRYDGYCSNVSWKKQKKADQEGLLPCILQSNE